MCARREEAVTETKPPLAVVIVFMAFAMAITGGLGIAIGMAMAKDPASAAWLTHWFFPAVLAVLWGGGNVSIYRILTMKGLT